MKIIIAGLIVEFSVSDCSLILTDNNYNCIRISIDTSNWTFFIRMFDRADIKQMMRLLLNEKNSKYRTIKFIKCIKNITVKEAIAFYKELIAIIIEDQKLKKEET